MPFTSSLIYRALVPKPVRTNILLNSLRKKIPQFLSSSSHASDPELQEVSKHIQEHGVSIFPYSFADGYTADRIDVFKDEANGLRYVLMEGKRLYFKRRWSETRIRRSFRDLSMEQDRQSPHRYLSPDFEVESDDIVADFGAAEGNFSLSVVDRVSKIYLFECDPEWIEALEHTFAPWRDKVEIVPRFVSDKDDDRHCSGDNYFQDRPVSFLKIDVDGGERQLLRGFNKILQQQRKMKIALCTYHQHEDEQEFTEKLQAIGFDVNPSPGYMVFYYDKKLRPPYLRRALVRAVKR
jgi:hypothetical protein